MKVAFITARAPYPCDSGGRIRTYHLLQEVARRHHVTLMTGVETAADVASLHRLRAELSELRVRAVTVPRRTSPYRQLVRLARLPYEKLPYTWTAYVDHRFACQLREWLAEEPYDLVHCDHVQVADMLVDAPTAPRLLNAHNIESVLARRIADRHRSVRRALIAWQARKVAEAERRCYRGFDRALVVSELDAALLENMVPGLPISVVPNGVDTEMFTPRDHGEEPHSIVFTGAMDWSPNVDGVSWFVRDVFPRIRARLGNATFTVVGRNPAPATVRELDGDGVRFTGTVDDVRPFLQAASVVAVPLLAGGGTRLKILEAWSMAKAVVSTSIGAEGLPTRDAGAVVIADTAEAFATDVIALLGDRARRLRLGIAGRALAEGRFAWRVVARSLLQAYEETAAIGGCAAVSRSGSSNRPAASPGPAR